MSATDLKVFFSPDYLAAACDFDTVRKAGWIVESFQRRPIPGVALVAPSALTEDDLQYVHDPAYMSALRTGEPRALAESSGLDWDLGLWVSLCASNGGVVAAALHALTTRQHAGSLSAGVHHARVASGAAFCAINGLALAVRAALDARAKRVLIIDVDAHCGGGTYSIVRQWPDVTHLDVAVNDFDRYEPESNTGSSLDIVTDARGYLPTLHNRLRALDNTEYDLLLLGAGVDCHEANGGPEGMTFQLLAEREAAVFTWAAERQIPVAFCLLGGYLSATLTEEGVSRLHRLTIAAAALANGGEKLAVNDIEELASTQNGSEGFAFDATGRKTDAGFHEGLLGEDEGDPFAYDMMEADKLTDAQRERFHRERHHYPGRQAEFIRKLLRGQGE